MVKSYAKGKALDRQGLHEFSDIEVYENEQFGVQYRTPKKSLLLAFSSSYFKHHRSLLYSVLKLFTGLATAALMD